MNLKEEMEQVDELLKELKQKRGNSITEPDMSFPKKGVLKRPSPDFEGTSWQRLQEMIGPVKWDWPGWLPRGFLTIVAAEPGMGKSLLCLRMAACYVEGKRLPDGTPFVGTRGRVVWCEGESSHSLNVSRAKAWGVSLTDIVSPLPNPFHAFRMDDGQHMTNLAYLCKRPEVRLVVMDSLSSLVVGGPTPTGILDKSVQGVPRALHILGEVARGTGKPILLTHHLRKRTAVDKDGFINLERLRGTGKIAQTARVVWTLDAPDSADPEHRRLAVVKNNLMPLAEPVGMRIGEGGLTFGEAPVFRGEAKPEPVLQIEEASAFLVGFLGEDVVPFSDVLEAGLAAGFSKRTLKRAKVRLGVRSKRIEGRKDWGWYVENN